MAPPTLAKTEDVPRPMERTTVGNTSALYT